MIYIIGAGLAGLAAGYELTKAGKKVTILEATERPGGRVKSLPVDGHMVDFGGFIVYPWYREYHRMAKELRVHDKFVDMPEMQVYYELEPSTFTENDDIKIPLEERLRAYAAALPKFVKERPTIESPALDSFGDQTIDEFLKDTYKKENTSALHTFADIICQGYCYAGVAEYRMGIVAPVFVNSTFLGGLKTTVSYAGNNSLFTDALAAAITASGGKVQYNELVTNIAPGTVTTDQLTYTADKIVYAGTYNHDFIPSLLDVDTPMPYTNFYNIVVEFDTPIIPKDMPDWGAIFYLPNNETEYQVLSAVNIHKLTQGNVNERFANFNIIDRTTDGATLSKEELLDKIKPELAQLYPGATPIKLSEYVHWTGTMPIATIPYLKAIQSAQGNNNIWYAGDALGSPGMETALRTGVMAAENILNMGTR